MTSAGVVYTLTYDASNKLIKQANADNSDVTTFTYNSQGLLSTESEIKGSYQTTTTYQYSGNSVGYTYTQSTGTTGQYTYTLDSQGYPQAVSFTSNAPPSALASTRYAYVYDNCKITERIAYNSDNSENTSSDTIFSYDAQGRVTERLSGLLDETYDYSCWP